MICRTRRSLSGCIRAAAGAGCCREARARSVPQLHNLRKAGKLPRLGKPAGSPPRIDEREEGALVELVVAAVGSLGQRDQLPYAEQFAPLVAAFNPADGAGIVAARCVAAGGEAGEVGGERHSAVPPAFEAAFHTVPPCLPAYLPPCCNPSAR